METLIRDLEDFS